MLESVDIYEQMEQCKHLIKNWEVMQGVDFDFLKVQIDAFSIDKQPDKNDEKWEISLLTTIHTQTTLIGRDVYSVKWGFKDLWGNLAFCSLQGHIFTGALCLKYIDYDDFALVGFSIIREDGSPIIKFDQPDEVSILSVEKKAFQSLQEIYPEDYLEDDNIN